MILQPSSSRHCKDPDVRRQMYKHSPSGMKHRSYINVSEIFLVWVLTVYRQYRHWEYPEKYRESPLKRFITLNWVEESYIWFALQEPNWRVLERRQSLINTIPWWTVLLLIILYLGGYLLIRVWSYKKCWDSHCMPHCFFYGRLHSYSNDRDCIHQN